MTPFERHLRRQKLGMSTQAELLLDIVRLAKQMPKFIEVKQTAMQKSASSPALSHQALHWLIDNGYLNCYVDLNDKRAKRLQVTRKGTNYLEEIER